MGNNHNNEGALYALAVFCVLLFMLFMSGCATKGDIQRLERRMNDDYDALTVKLNYHISVMDSRIDNLDAKLYDLNYRGENKYRKAAQIAAEKTDRELNVNH